MVLMATRDGAERRPNRARFDEKRLKRKGTVACGSFFKPSAVKIHRGSSSVQYPYFISNPFFMDVYV